MWETIAIIVCLGGLETFLWWKERNRQIKLEREDSLVQQKQTEILDGILTELAIANGE